MAPQSATDQIWISRCFQLAARGIGNVSPNPPVGAVIVYENRILGEGYHSFFGGPHAEVEAFRNVRDEDRHLLPQSTLYVSLEPCCTNGKTPPCTALILREKVKDVRIAIIDPNPNVAGKGIEILKSNGVNVTKGILEEQANELIRPFATNIIRHRPYVILKWAQSTHGYIGKTDEKVWLSNAYTNIWSHKKRSEVDAIIVGARTILLDDPLLTTREYAGRSPHRVVYDPNGILPGTSRVFQQDGRQIFYFSFKENLTLSNHILTYKLHEAASHIDQILSMLMQHNIGILLVEGGAFLHHLFIQQNAWDEVWVIQTQHQLNEGIKAPDVRGKLIEKIESDSDKIIRMMNDHSL